MFLCDQVDINHGEAAFLWKHVVYAPTNPLSGMHYGTTI